MRSFMSSLFFILGTLSIQANAQTTTTQLVTPVSITLTQMPSVYFVGKNLRLTDDNKQMLARIARVIRNNPDYDFSLTGYCVGKYQIQQSGLRVNAIVRYLVEMQGISRDRFVQIFGADGGDCQTIDFRSIKQE